MVKVLQQDCKKGEPVNLRIWLYGVTCNNMTRMIIGKRYRASKPTVVFETWVNWKRTRLLLLNIGLA